MFVTYSTSSSQHELTCISVVGAMFYLSPTLTLLMLAVVPPVSLGAVSHSYLSQAADWTSE